jgi:acyl dehydratase
MPLRIVNGLMELSALVDQEVAVSDYLEVTQSRIDQFAEATEDRQWIHTDVARAQQESAYGGTIAHGFLTLSLLAHFLQQSIQIDNIRMSINYGLNSLRFPAVVLAGTKIRARFTLASLQQLGDATQAVWKVTVEAAEAKKPCCVAEWLVRYY